MTSKQLDLIEKQELIQKLIDEGHGELIDLLLSSDSKIYTKKGRLNKSAVCRVLGWKPKKLEEVLNTCRDILGADLF